MFQKVKRWLGIEGVKVEIEMPTYFKQTDKELFGRLKLMSLDNHLIEQIEYKLIERYKRGRGATKLIDEYILGIKVSKEKLILKSSETVYIDFMLPIKPNLSAVEKFGDKNFLAKGLATGVKWLKGAKSEYRLEVRIKVRDIRLDPFASFHLIRD
jgi:hypothetical protein